MYRVSVCWKGSPTKYSRSKLPAKPSSPLSHRPTEQRQTRYVTTIQHLDLIGAQLTLNCIERGKRKTFYNVDKISFRRL